MKIDGRGMTGLFAGFCHLMSVDSSPRICGQVIFVRSIASYGQRGLGREKHAPKVGNHHDSRPAGVSRLILFRERALSADRSLGSWVENHWCGKERLQVM